MFVFRKNCVKIPFFQRRFCTTNIYHEEIIQQLPVCFGAGLDLIEKTDANFQTIRSFKKEVVANKDQINKIRDLYIQIFKTLSGDSKLSGLTGQIEPRLLERIEESMRYLKDNGLKVGLLGNSILGKSDQEIQKSFDINQIGILKVFNIDTNRKNNLFIHQYMIEKIEDRLTYIAKENKREDVQLKSKKQRMAEDMLENFNSSERNESPLKKNVWKIAKGIGFMTPEDMHKPGLIQRFFTFKNSLHDKMEGEDHILVEDFEISSPLGLYIQDTKTGNVIKSEGKDGNLFRHFFRVEKKLEAKDAPSLRKQKNYILTDIDFSLRGNPHALVKNFAEC